LSHPVKPTDVGTNRTGVKAAPPQHVKETISGAVDAVPPPPHPTDQPSALALRAEIASTSPPVGTMPPAAPDATTDETVTSTALLDKLGERLAYERGGVRLYEALLAKFDASHNHDPSITRAALVAIRDDELAHALMLAQCIEECGGDSTAVTPCADVVGVASSGFMQVLTDPRTTFTQCLGTMMMVEVGDLVSWELLAGLAAGLGMTALVERFQLALADEERHTQQLRAWLTTALSGQAQTTAQDASPAR
jgi:hypothetical protein